MKAADVRELVKEFQQKTAQPRTEHCFAPWYIHQTFSVAPSQALDQSSDGSYDYNVDGFHLYDSDGAKELLVLQAKFSDSVGQISAGIRGFSKCLAEIGSCLDGIGSEIPIQNKVLVNLREALGRLSEDSRKALRLDFRVIHLSDEDSILIGEKTKNARDDFLKAVNEVLPDHNVTVRDVPPSEMGSRLSRFVPPEKTRLSIDKMQPSLSLSTGEEMYYGIGRLSELVDLYGRKRENLFSKNVRYYIDTRENIERGPVGKMRETLRRIAIEKTQDRLEPHIFAFYHNGVTLSTENVTPTEGGVELSDPYVLNGCQTIKNAFLFRNQRGTREKIDDGVWREIPIPLRIIRTSGDELVRNVTVNNNRQNAISASALHANDPVHVGLEQRFEGAGIFYERQAGAYEALRNTDPKQLSDKYPNTKQGYDIWIEDLARSISATAREITWAEHPTRLFETESAHARCFSNKRLKSLVFLTYLQNLHDVIGPVLLHNLGLEQIGEGPKPKRLTYYAIYLLNQYLTKEKNSTFIEAAGRVCGPPKGFREGVARLFRASGIQSELKSDFMRVGENSSTLLNEALDRTEHTLRLHDYDPFEAFGALA